MKKILSCSVFVLLIVIPCIAQEKKADPENTRALLFGVNFIQSVAGDFELYARYKFNQRNALMVAAGYDLNFIDRGKNCDPDHLMAGYGEGDNTNQWTTYFYGNGPSGRLVYDYVFDPETQRKKFISVSIVGKYRTYDNYEFLPLHGYHAVCESGKQSILGLNVHMGPIIEWQHFTLRIYFGAGFRYVYNDMVWRYKKSSSSEIITEDQERTMMLPLIDFGIIFFIKAFGN